MQIPPSKLAWHLVAYFDEIAPEYERWAGRLHAKAAAELGDWAAPQPGDRCLDVGTGTGLVARWLGPRVAPTGEVVGVDPSGGMLAQARASVAGAANIRFIKMGGERLVFRDRSFDLVTYGESLTYLLDPFASLDEARRVLKRGGRIAVSCQRRSLNTVAQEVSFAWLEKLATEHGVSVPRHDHSHGSFGEPEVMRELLEEAGFREVRITQMVTGVRATDFNQWMDLLAGLGPFSHELIVSMGPVRLKTLADALGKEMDRLGEDGWRIHHSFTLAGAISP